MRRIVCGECRKKYDYDVDDFCPRCGAYNPPKRNQETTMRVDGISESNHKDSFLHEELHQEKKERKRLGLSKGVRREPQQTEQRSAVKEKEPSAAPKLSSKKKSTEESFDMKKIMWLIVLGIAVLLEMCSA